MGLDFLDNGLPVESGSFEIASEDIHRFRMYCKELGKTASELTEDELDKFRNEAS